MNERGQREKIPEIADRLCGMIWGQFVGDAASLGSHWIYDLEEMAAAYPEGIHGFETPRQGHYHYGKRPGDLTHYGDGALILLESVAKLEHFDERDFGSRYIAAMNPKTYGGYIDHATLETLDLKREFEEKHPGDHFDFQRGANDDQLSTVTSITPLVAAHYGDEGLLGVVDRATRVRQQNERTVAYVRTFVQILLELLKGRDIHSALHRTEEVAGRITEQGSLMKGKIGSAFMRLPASVEIATDQLGQSCPLPCSFPSAVHSLLKFDSGFEETILRVIRAGGDNAGRAAMVGAWLGAHLGVDAIPLGWRQRLTEGERIAKGIERIVRVE